MRWHAPLYEGLAALRRTQPSSFHVPGHKYGRLLDLLGSVETTTAEVFRSLMEIDVTELSVTDDLHDPSGIIAEAQQLAALCYGAEETFFLVGGSTAGNLAMLLGCCQPGELVIVQRNAHKSILNGLALAGAQAVFIMPQREVQTGLDCVPALSDVEEAVRRHPEARAVLLTNPSYYGAHVDLTPYAALVHDHGKLLLVDEAHGAHYGHHPSFPRSALQAGADAVVQSTHKTLPALTMGAMLHLQGERIDREAIRHALTMIQSSSPSYPIMASLDIARAMLDVLGSSMFDKGILGAQAFKQWLQSMNHDVKHSVKPGVALHDGGRGPLLEVVDGKKHRIIDGMDPLRIVLGDRTGLLSGYELQRQLEKRGCWVEMADPLYVVLLFGAAVSEKDIIRLQDALSEIAQEYSSIHTVRNADEGEPKAYINEASDFEYKRNEADWITLGEESERISKPIVFSRRGIDLSTTERIPVAEAVGRIAAEAVIPYPPGIPILYKGETITARTVSYIQKLALHGARCQGATDPTMQSLAVIADS
ncbi:aminotransferase class I/II-fold pyridoxal phosphate-dependent enzyme [Paenibacillus oenotherae]|uniref:Aminotransferase class I/II-fold pyridoxal phosphate-dependent enzyme n=1 Tax=Paenibacillus oenotherae TaxID=1435645 RepID=A0ABS7DBQ6_9BACL|nr:aminotransferase class I/II-fold pyridoxal phosphate-dependent enzyme [Paenibacillus oenotherae]